MTRMMTRWEPLREMVGLRDAMDPNMKPRLK